MSDGLSRVRAMVVFSNRRLGPAAELLVSPDVAIAMLRATAEAARPLAHGHWEHELVRWLGERARRFAAVEAPGARRDRHQHQVDVAELAWSPENFERQKAFVTEAIERAAVGSPHARALVLWVRMIDAHPRSWVVVGRRWQWAIDNANA